MTKEKLSSIYCAFLVLFMPLGMYSSGILTFSISDILLFVLLLVIGAFCLFRLNHLKCMTVFVPIIAYIVVQTMLLGDSMSTVLRAGRYVVYLIFIALFSLEFFDEKKAFKYYSIVACFSTAFIILQFVVFKLLRYYIPGYIPFLKVARDELVAYSEGIYTKTSTAVRMRSIFQEPAHYASYVTGCLMLSLLRYEKTRKKKYLYLCAFLTFGILIAASSTGILVAGICWGMFLIKHIKKPSKKMMLALIVVFLLVIPNIVKMDTFQMVVLRLQGGRTQQNRFGGYSEIWRLININLRTLFFGYGMKMYESYLASWSRMLYYFGIVGVITYIVPFFLNSLKKREHFRIFCFLMLMGTGTSLLLSGNSMLLLSFMVCNNKDNVVVEE